MPDLPQAQDPASLKRRALAIWDNEGGALASETHDAMFDIAPLGDAEVIHLRIRMIAMENLLIAVLAEGSDRQIAVAQEMAHYISPRPGMTPHPLTIRAADHMTDILARAEHYRALEQE